MFTQFLTALQESSYDNLYDYINNQGKQLLMELTEKNSSFPSYEEDSSFYRDFDKTEEFSLDGLTQGECSSGVVDMIESDLLSAEHYLTTAREKELDLEVIRHALLSASRALLVVKGVDPKEEPAIINAFIAKFVDTHIFPEEFLHIRDVFDQISSKEIKKETAYDFTSTLYEAVKETYALMDSTFNFPARFQNEGK
jgi:sulfite reductase (ferredoxin)